MLCSLSAYGIITKIIYGVYIPEVTTSESNGKEARGQFEGQNFYPTNQPVGVAVISADGMNCVNPLDQF